jgi:GxxExxY protein
LQLNGLRFQREVSLPVRYKSLRLDCAYRLDLLVEDLVIVEIKSVEALAAIHQAQLLTYLRAANKQVGLLMNFNVAVLKDGLKRVVNNSDENSLGFSPRFLRDLSVSAVNTEPL